MSNLTKTLLVILVAVSLVWFCLAVNNLVRDMRYQTINKASVERVSSAPNTTINTINAHDFRMERKRHQRWWLIAFPGL